ncbi:MipA/OmpV family protein [Dechloromonas sp. TW-R-39-2]|jgi:outer membrane scaffolding protein for murein synthesis (MipA/OmpV family)|uniref:MipA/OmpV family protein n=1 Tax=Dechloromonas sp. TW-R-39-2 TaxID=2654218 RepID=UPI00193EBB5F|nr:MipA/OmpV family protein [Dechloromonas sp. TW-R-39-2]QRM18208.1 MipA/OmpV family protein [Dechloromonas sp. TW-R-39-2]
MTSPQYRRIIRLIALSLGLSSGAMQAAEEKPLWEIGAGVAAFSFPSYRGSDQTNNFLMPVPHFTYHGDFLKADRHGIRGSFFDSDRLDLTLSVALSPPVSSKDITARAGMSDLKGTFEIGPEMDVTFWRSDNKARFIKLLMPLRAAITVEGSPKEIGWVFHPKLNMDITDLPGMPGWNLGMLAGPLFGDQKQHAYYYSVDPRYATAGRPAYEAKAGYAGMQYLLALSKRFPGYWLGGFVRYDNLGGSVFEDSPLVRQKDYVAAGAAITWVLGESSTRVRVND